MNARLVNCLVKINVLKIILIIIYKQMTKIWFAIGMTFNISLYISLLLILLPNAKCVANRTKAPTKSEIYFLLIFSDTNS